MIKVNQDARDVYIHIPSLSLSSYTIRYSFKVLLPILEVLFRKEEAIDKDKDEAPNSRLT
jgi:DnaJ family protein C protein 11